MTYISLAKRPCDVCGIEYQPRKGTHLYCSNACRLLACSAKTAGKTRSRLYVPRVGAGPGYGHEKPEPHVGWWRKPHKEWHRTWTKLSWREAFLALLASAPPECDLMVLEPGEHPDVVLARQCLSGRCPDDEVLERYAEGE